MNDLEADFKLDPLTVSWTLTISDRVSTEDLRTMCQDACSYFVQMFSKMPDGPEKRFADLAIEKLMKNDVRVRLKQKEVEL